MSNVLEVRDLYVGYYNKKKLFEPAQYKEVLKDITFDIRENEIMGLVGQSGCGKTTLSKAILGVIPYKSGDIKHMTTRPQMIFQDPYSSLNLVKKIGWILEEPLKVIGGYTKAERKDKAIWMLEKVGLSGDYYNRLPKELSGGQRQRISIGQALMQNPGFIIADEPVSALDVTVQAQIMDLLLELKEEMKLSYLFISHDIDVIYQMCDRVMVLNNGEIVEMGEVTQVLDNPKDSYTKMLVSL